MLFTRKFLCTFKELFRCCFVFRVMGCNPVFFVPTSRTDVGLVVPVIQVTTTFHACHIIYLQQKNLWFEHILSGLELQLCTTPEDHLRQLCTISYYLLHIALNKENAIHILFPKVGKNIGFTQKLFPKVGKKVSIKKIITHPSLLKVLV